MTDRALAGIVAGDFPCDREPSVRIQAEMTENIRRRTDGAEKGTHANGRAFSMFSATGHTGSRL
jgi:hypothetical protein